MKSPSSRHVGLVLLSLAACGLPDKNLGELADTGEGGAGASTETTSVDPTTMGDSSDDGAEGSQLPGCTPDEPYTCAGDPDRDGLGHACDNAPEAFNPAQADLDEDGIGDVIDLCPTVPGSNNSADSDDDGIGNDCDSCRRDTSIYNEHAHPGVPFFMQVRNIPDVGDADGDGIGDACDNCVAVPNCATFDASNPWQPGLEIPDDDPNLCQRDDDEDMIGDACAGMQLAGAAGPVGFFDDDDFDQDGLTNEVDGCVRLPLRAAVPCTGDDECPTDARCEPTMGLCDHADADDDGVGDACDTCAFTPNLGQLVEGDHVEDDEDQDFVGEACEGALVYPSPLPGAFWSRSAEGRCCSVLLVADERSGDLRHAESGAPLLDPDGLPVRVDCVEAEDPMLRTCRTLPAFVVATPGVLALPPGCDGEAGMPVGLADVGGDAFALWQLRCELPQLDQDFDGIADAADFCPFAFDPSNMEYVDEGGRVWPNDGRYCNGEYSPEAVCGE